jgi:hypothetical protein
MKVKINEAYRDYNPPFDATSVVRRLLKPVPDKYLVGLDCIVLSNFSGLSRDRRIGKLVSRKRRVSKSRTLGYYRREWHGQPAYIELYVDKIAEYIKVERGPTWIPAFRDVCFGLVLYHELGHHAHRVVRPEYREREDVADDWARKFTKNFMWKRYWYLRPLFLLANRVYRMIRYFRSSRPS